MTAKMSELFLVAPQEVKRFVTECMVAVGAAGKHGEILADTLVAADRRGHYSHGLNRLEMYMKEVQSTACDGNATPVVVKETPSTALVDARNGLGSVAGTFCMELAIEKAKKTGLAWVTCAHSNHYGIAGYYSQMATRNGLVGMSMTNTSPLMMPTRARKEMLGTNPIAFGAPGIEGDDFMLDMATTAVAIGKVEVNHRKQEPIPVGWGINKDGKDITDTTEFNKDGILLPLGGREETSGYKGYGLGTMVEVLCGVMSGGPYAGHIRKWTGDPSKADLGQMFMALDPSVFVDDFPARLNGLMSDLRNMEPMDPSKPVMVAGDPERIHEKMSEQDGGITYHHSIIDAMDRIAKDTNVPQMARTVKLQS